MTELPPPKPIDASHAPGDKGDSVAPQKPARQTRVTKAATSKPIRASSSMLGCSGSLMCVMNVLGLLLTGLVVVGSRYVVLPVYQDQQLPIPTFTRVFFSVPAWAIGLTVIVLAALLVAKQAMMRRKGWALVIEIVVTALTSVLIGAYAVAMVLPIVGLMQQLSVP